MYKIFLKYTCNCLEHGETKSSTRNTNTFRQCFSTLKRLYLKLVSTKQADIRLLRKLSHSR